MYLLEYLIVSGMVKIPAGAVNLISSQVSTKLESK